MRILITLVMLLPVSTYAEPIKMRGGEHTDFTRITFSKTPDVVLEVEETSDAIAIYSEANDLEFDASEVFDRLNDDRITEVREKNNTMFLIKRCDCEARTYLIGETLFVVDIFDEESGFLESSASVNVNALGIQSAWSTARSNFNNPWMKTPFLSTSSANLDFGFGDFESNRFEEYGSPNDDGLSPRVNPDKEDNRFVPLYSVRAAELESILMAAHFGEFTNQPARSRTVGPLSTTDHFDKPVSLDVPQEAGYSVGGFPPDVDAAAEHQRCGQIFLKTLGESGQPDDFRMSVRELARRNFQGDLVGTDFSFALIGTYVRFGLFAEALNFARSLDVGETPVHLDLDDSLHDELYSPAGSVQTVGCSFEQFAADAQADLSQSSTDCGSTGVCTNPLVNWWFAEAKKIEESLRLQGADLPTALNVAQTMQTEDRTSVEQRPKLNTTTADQTDFFPFGFLDTLTASSVDLNKPPFDAISEAARTWDTGLVASENSIAVLESFVSVYPSQPVRGWLTEALFFSLVSRSQFYEAFEVIQSTSNREKAQFFENVLLHSVQTHGREIDELVLGLRYFDASGRLLPETMERHPWISSADVDLERLSGP